MAIVQSREHRRATGREHNPRLPREQEAYREDVFAVYLPAPQPGPADPGSGLGFGLHVLLVDHELLQRTISRFFHEFIPCGG